MRDLAGRAWNDKSLGDQDPGEGKTPSDDDASDEGRRVPLKALSIFLALALGSASLALTFWHFGNSRPTASHVGGELAVFELAPMTLNLRSDVDRQSYLRVVIALECRDKATCDALAPYAPRLIDAFQIFLRELRPEELTGTASLFHIKGELLKRVNALAAPLRVEQVLFNEFLVQ